MIPVMDMAVKRSWRDSLNPEGVFQDHAGDIIRSRGFVVRGATESLLHDSMGDASRYHWDGVLLAGRNAV